VYAQANEATTVFSNKIEYVTVPPQEYNPMMPFVAVPQMWANIAIISPIAGGGGQVTTQPLAINAGMQGDVLWRGQNAFTSVELEAPEKPGWQYIGTLVQGVDMTSYPNLGHPDPNGAQGYTDASSMTSGGPMFMLDTIFNANLPPGNPNPAGPYIPTGANFGAWFGEVAPGGNNQALISGEQRVCTPWFMLVDQTKLPLFSPQITQIEVIIPDLYKKGVVGPFQAVRLDNLSKDQTLQFNMQNMVEVVATGRTNELRHSGAELTIINSDVATLLNLLWNTDKTPFQTIYTDDAWEEMQNRLKVIKTPAQLLQLFSESFATGKVIAAANAAGFFGDAANSVAKQVQAAIQHHLPRLIEGAQRGLKRIGREAMDTGYDVGAGALQGAFQGGRSALRRRLNGSASGMFGGEGAEAGGAMAPMWGGGGAQGMFGNGGEAGGAMAPMWGGGGDAAGLFQTLGGAVGGLADDVFGGAGGMFGKDEGEAAGLFGSIGGVVGGLADTLLGGADGAFCPHGSTADMSGHAAGPFALSYYDEHPHAFGMKPGANGGIFSGLLMTYNQMRYCVLTYLHLLYYNGIGREDTLPKNGSWQELVKTGWLRNVNGCLMFDTDRVGALFVQVAMACADGSSRDFQPDRNKVNFTTITSYGQLEAYANQGVQQKLFDEKASRQMLNKYAFAMGMKDAKGNTYGLAPWEAAIADSVPGSGGMFNPNQQTASAAQLAALPYNKAKLVLYGTDFIMIPSRCLADFDQVFENEGCHIGGQTEFLIENAVENRMKYENYALRDAPRLLRPNKYWEERADHALTKFRMPWPFSSWFVQAYANQTAQDGYVNYDRRKALGELNVKGGRTRKAPIQGGPGRYLQQYWLQQQQQRQRGVKQEEGD
jgi:hypothetical protein